MLNKLPLWATFATLAVIGSMFVDTGSSVEAFPSLPMTDIACHSTEPLLFVNAGRLQEGEFAIFSDGLIALQRCSPGRLTFTARGSYAAGHGAHLVVSLQDQVLWEGEVLEPREFEIPVPGPGWLTLAFVNDYYSPPEDRNLWISNLSFMPDF